MCQTLSLFKSKAFRVFSLECFKMKYISTALKKVKNSEMKIFNSIPKYFYSFSFSSSTILTNQLFT